MRNNKSLIDILLQFKQPIVVVTSILVLLGLIALYFMPRDEFPEFEIRQGVIIGVYPGATSEQVEEQLTKKVENYLFQYESINKNKTYSVSKENLMVIYVEIDKNVKDPKVFWSKIKYGLQTFKSELPSGVMSLTVNDDFGNTSAILMAVESETKTYKELEKYIEKFEEDVRKIPETSRVKRFGLQREEINVYIDDAKLTQYGIKPLTVIAMLQPQNMINYAGEIDDGKLIRPIHVAISHKSENDIANQIVYSDPTGTVIRVKDIATVKREYVEPDSYIRLNGNKCLLVSLEMMPGNNIVNFGRKVEKEIYKFKASMPSDVKIGIISDLPHFVSNSIFNFLKEFAIAIIAVILVTIILLPRRVALVAASAIPISVFITLGVMWVMGMTLQTVSLAGLIIVLGMVVDNAIVIIDNYVEKLDSGITPHEAASQSVSELFISVFSATLILIFSFLPMVLFMLGMAGDFVESLPMTITIALSTSLFVSVVIVPLLSYKFIKVGIKNENNTRKSRFLNKLQQVYDNSVESAFRKKKTVVLLGGASFVLGILLLALAPQQPFPAFDRNQFTVEVFLPTGSSLAQTDSVLKDLEALLAKDERVEEVAAFVGTSSPRFNTLYAPHFPEKNFGQLLVITESSEATLEILKEYGETYSCHNPKAIVNWKQLAMMYSETSVEVRVYGDEISEIKHVANKIMDIFRDVEGIRWMRTNYQNSLQAVRLNLKQDEASRLGYVKPVLDYSLLIGTKGFPVTTIWEDDYPVSVNLKVDEGQKSNVNEVMDQYVSSPYLATSSQVRQIADAEMEWTQGAIVRRNGVRSLTIQVNPRLGVLAADVLDVARPKIDALELPQGLSIEYGGVYETNLEEVTPMYYAMAVTIAIIFIILLFQFKNTRTAILIMMTMPLSIFGATFGIIVTGYPFGVTALIGLISLMGIIVRNGIIYISYAEHLRSAFNYSVQEAAIAAGKRRMRPIFLTAAAAAVGVVPMILSGSPLWGPLGSIICFGLLFGMILSLLVLPVLYYVFHRNEDKTLTKSELV